MDDASSCYACGSETRTVTVGVARLRICACCGLGRTADRAEADDRAEAADYWTRGPDGESEADQRYWTDARGGVFAGALSLLEGRCGKGRVLDLGGGVGHFAQLALAAGWDAYSVDISEVAAAAAARRIGQARALTTIPAEIEGSCDAVTLWCVIAHLADPHAVLADALRALRPGGLLFLTTPNFWFQRRYAAALARVGRPIDFSAHDHVLHFTEDALGRTLAAVGLTAWQRVFVGVTEDCVAEPRLARWAVPAKRAWNRAALAAARAGVPYVGSELQVVGTAP